MKRFLSVLLAAVSVFTFSGCSRLFGRKSEPVQPHLIKSSQKESSPLRPINSAEVEQARFVTDKDEDPLETQLAELYDIVVINKKRPDFRASDLNSEVQNVYNEAVNVLDRYILNSFTDYERVHAIHDYLTFYIAYDQQLYLDYIADPEGRMVSDSFGLNGVFLSKTAVCDGFSQAFSLLCAIEGIESEKIEGSCNYDGQVVPHTWNKVKIDGAWHNIDITLDSITFNTEKGESIKVMHHGYFLLSDPALQDFGRHRFTGGSYGYSAATDYPYYKDALIFDAETSTLKAEVTTQEEFNAVFEFIKNSKRKYGQVELRLNMGLTDAQTALLDDAYSEHIKAAYKVVDGIFAGKDFAYAPEKGVRPYQKFPRSVFVFLIYK